MLLLRRLNCQIARVIQVRFYEPEEPDCLAKSFELGSQAAEMMNGHWQHPNRLELEKVLMPMLLWGKKMYAAALFESPTSSAYLCIKGISVIRRDSCPFVRDTCRDLLNIMMFDRDPDRAKQVARDAARELLTGAVDPQRLIMSKKLAAAYKSEKHPQVVVKDKMAQRVSDGTSAEAPPQAGDRVAFLYGTPRKRKIRPIRGDGDHKELTCMKAEDPSFLARQEDVLVDYEHYYEHCFKKPVTMLLNMVDPRADRLYEDIVGDFQRKKHRQRAITDMFHRA